MNRQEFHADMVRLVTALIPTIRDDYRASDDSDDNEPGMCLTVGADADGWGYQTGDNSYSGAAYRYATWAIVYLYREADPSAVAGDIVAQLVEQAPDDEPIFEDDSEVQS